MKVFIQGLICNETETEKTENGSFGNAQALERKRILPEGANRKRFANKRTEADMRGPHVRFEKARRRPKTAVDAGVELRRIRRNGGYQELQRLLPRRWVVASSNGEHHVDDDTISGGRRFG